MLKKEARESITTNTKKGQPQTREKEKGTRKNKRLQFTQNTHSRAHILLPIHTKKHCWSGFCSLLYHKQLGGGGSLSFATVDTHVGAVGIL